MGIFDTRMLETTQPLVEHFATAITYDDGSGSPVAVSALVGRERTEVVDTPEGQILRRVRTVSVRRSEISRPPKGALFTISSEAWKVREIESLTATWCRALCQSVASVEKTRSEYRK